MDIYSLTAAHMRITARPARMSAREEDRYYSNQVALPRLDPRLIGAISMVVSVILIFGVGLI